MQEETLLQPEGAILRLDHVELQSWEKAFANLFCVGQAEKKVSKSWKTFLEATYNGFFSALYMNQNNNIRLEWELTQVEISE